ncbi:MAG: YbaK/EbsC family protein [Candidatus Limnocylindrales bacterium]|jgi:prolyl-tRNA editing enzyme YbaK/EbsC (Cys-tRNA(Pro) deacylase)
MAGWARTAEETAVAVHAELGQIVNSIVLVAPRPEGRLIPIVFLVSGRNQVDLGLLAAVTGESSVRRATARETTELTGYSAGGIPPFGHGRDVRVVMDQDLCQYQSVWAAAGTDAAVFQIAPRTLRMLCNAVVAPLAQASLVRRAGLQFEPRLQCGAGTGA